MTLEELKKTIKGAKEHINSKRGELEILKAQIKEKESEKQELLDSNSKLLTMKSLIEESCTEARENGKKLLSEISTSSVQTVFDENTEVELVLESNNGIPVADVIVRDKYEDGCTEIDPANSDGGGLADVVSLSLFMAMGETTTDNYAPYFLDEPTKFVSKGELSEKSADFVDTIVEYTGKQTILSTHDEFLLEAGSTRHRMVKDKTTGITEVIPEIIGEE